jgi:hypothetical protein
MLEKPLNVPLKSGNVALGSDKVDGILNNSKRLKDTGGIKTKSTANISKELTNKSDRTDVPRSRSSLSMKPTSLDSDSVPTSTNLKQGEGSIINTSDAYGDTVPLQRFATRKRLESEYEDNVDATLSCTGANSNASGTGAGTSTSGVAKGVSVGTGNAAALYDPLDGKKTGIFSLYSIILLI